MIRISKNKTRKDVFSFDKMAPVKKTANTKTKQATHQRGTGEQPRATSLFKDQSSVLYFILVCLYLIH
jgi:hypothetical protein